MEMTYSEKSTGRLPDPVQDAEFYDGVPLKRALAWVVDAVLIVILSVIGGFMTLGIAFLFAGFLFMSTSFIYRVGFIAAKSATPGMMLMGIEFRNLDGQRFEFKEALIHTGIYTLVMMTFFGHLISIISMATTERGRAIQDFVLGSTAINKPLE